eukprot:CCRYP_016449-RA/>CCRYP_016449-RA protein AED:0.58 eAED:0.31 QI:0/0/0/1/0/0/2/0/150
MAITKILQSQAVSWYHCYLQHPGHTCLEEMLHAVMYWAGMRCIIRSHVKNCRICQVNKQHKHKYGKLPSKLVITNSWEAFWLEIVELPVLRTTELDMANTVVNSSIDAFLTNAPMCHLLNQPHSTKGPEDQNNRSMQHENTTVEKTLKKK